MTGTRRSAVLVLATLLPAAAAASSPEAPAGYEYDPENAQDIMELCAGCHGEHGQGGGGGEYPRLAGLPVEYLHDQMMAYRTGVRPGIAMVPYAAENELTAADLLDITTYLAEIELPARMPVIDQSLDSYEKLLIAAKVFNVPRVEGDVDAGREIYADACADCHGDAGAGDGDVPRLAGQHTQYLRQQIENFRSGIRPNEDMAGILDELTGEDVAALLAYLSTADD